MSHAARTYNQDHIARKYTPGKRRLSIYWSWSYPWESQRDLTEMENRFSTMTEVRRVAWPNYEKPEWGSAPGEADKRGAAPPHPAGQTLDISDGRSEARAAAAGQ